MANRWQLTADTGGTFTDCLGGAPDGTEHRVKVLSNGSLRGSLVRIDGGRRLYLKTEWTAPADFCADFAVWMDGRFVGRVARDNLSAGWIELVEAAEWPDAPAGTVVELRSGDEAPVLAARLMTQTPVGRPLPALELRLGTTRGTNALLEGKGAPVALFVSKGFRDLCRIGTQQRPDLFARHIERPPALYRQVFEVQGRYALDGEEVEQLNLDELPAAIDEAVAAGCEVAAVALIQSYRHPGHERQVVEALRASGAFRYVVGSAELRPFIHYLRRTETAVVDATLGPVMERYLDGVERALGTAQLRIMTSAGSLLSRQRFRPVDSLLSGPAAGVAGAASAGRRAGLKRLITFDMGGTSTDVSRWDGDFAYQAEQRVGPARILARGVKIETVAAGGGSICGFEADRPSVGPASAGASPGPACYGAGGPLTVTDVNLLLGRLDPAGFQIPVTLTAAEAAWDAVRIGENGESEALLSGLLQLANERMAQAIRQISVRDGYDPAGFGLVAFGGAGGLHACAVAEILGMGTIVFPRNAGLLSAEGLAHTGFDATHEQQVLCGVDDWSRSREAILAKLRAAARADLEAEGLSPETVGQLSEEVTLEVRMRGQEASLAVPDSEDLETAFAGRHEQIFGYRRDGVRLEVVSARLRLATGPLSVEAEDFEVNAPAPVPAPHRILQSWFNGGRLPTPVHPRDALPVGAPLMGPAIVTDAFSTLVVAPGWRAVKGSAGTIKLTPLPVELSAEDAREASPERPATEAAALVKRELLLHRFEGMVEEMGEQLRRTALSTNIRERLDFSCALLDADGTLLVNAPHIPVHLGALGECVRQVLRVRALRPGDVIVTNHPAYGGSHLPDVTVLTGVFDRGRRIAILANRAHHAEIGGSRPGSMPPHARCLTEEGVVIPPSYLVEAGRSRFDAVEQLLSGGPWPTRALAENLTDLHAQVAANRRGARMLEALIEAEGVETIEHFLKAAADISETAASRCLAHLGDRVATARDSLDDGTPVAVCATIAEGRLTLDFSGTGEVHPGNFNATPAIVRSAVLYVLRLLVDENLPLNEGMLRPVELIVPPGLLNPPFSEDPNRCPAVVGGNIETSQRVVEVLLTAFALLAQSQGTMNNVLFGDDAFGYYETVGGGSGAGEGFPGASGVHVHMTNTAITDAEILEHRYPLRIRRFALRKGSGGTGRWHGGNGLIREYEFLRAMRVSLLAQRRVRAPSGADGGNAGATGRQTRIHPDGRSEELGGLAAWDPVAGERLILETPGGGGWGPPVPNSRGGD